ncbi:MAG: MOSC domain-containing protein [Gammaproteobacteria bacterium]|nr:MOSC domain-containing protein [Gammaproteobacteria bacterium]
MDSAKHLTTADLEQGLEYILESPKDNGELTLIVRRPERDQRESVAEGYLDTERGLVGDNWLSRGNRHTPDGAADPEMQLNIMNSRVAGLVAQDPDRMQLAGDQLYLDLDLSGENLPHGTRLALGDAVIEVTEPPHTGCKKFAERFGKEAVVFVNSGFGRKQNFRGINARVIQSGDIKVGDVARKIT